MKYVFFWGHETNRPDTVGKECLSQWYPAAFTVNGVRFPTSEHFMMFHKAKLFGDDEAASGMLTASATSSSRTAASDFAAAFSPRHELSVARHIRRICAPARPRRYNPAAAWSGVALAARSALSRSASRKASSIACSACTSSPMSSAAT